MGKKDARHPQEYERAPFLLSVDEAAQELETSTETGIKGDAKVNEKLQKYGPNTLEGEGGVKWYALLGKQISNAMIMVRLLFRSLASPKMQCSPYPIPYEQMARNHTTVDGC